ncbi:MAG: hypothetical protein R3190_05820, partial [Thermoanaerobaculia bacterium]|nr:hypothetical protein [Thermoanaerobaculia bacterium]
YAEQDGDEVLTIETPQGRVFRGWRALAVLPLVAPAPFLAALIVLRFGSSFVGLVLLGYGLDDVIFVLLALNGLLLSPVADRPLPRAAYRRVAGMWNRCLGRLAGA